MLNNIQSDDILQNNSISQQIKLAEVDKKASQNPYLKLAEFDDVIEISDKARELYEKEKEIEKYKSMVLESLKSDLEVEQTSSILESIESGKYINNETLAEKMIDKNMTFEGKELLDLLYSDAEEFSENAFLDLLETDT